MAMGGTAVLPFAVAAGAIVGTGAGVGYAGYKVAYALRLSMQDGQEYVNLPHDNAVNKGRE